MTETDAAAPVFPPGRYGRRRDPRRGTPNRIRTVALLVVGAVVGLVLAVALTGKYGPSGYEPQVISFHTADRQVTMRFEVLKPSGRPAVCHVRSRDRAGAEVGSADVRVPAGTDVSTTYTLVTTGKAVSAEVTACRAA